MKLRLGLKTGATLFMGLLIVALAAGCGGDDEISVGDFEGTWDATSFTVTSNDNPAISLDAVAAGATMRGVVDDSGNLTGQLQLPEALGGPATLGSRIGGA